jgi:DNA-binding transcriptional MerR regulator
MDTTNEWLTARELAKMANVTTNAVHKWKSEGKIPPELIRVERRGFAKRVYFHRSILEKLFGKEAKSHE